VTCSIAVSDDNHASFPLFDVTEVLPTVQETSFHIHKNSFCTESCCPAHCRILGLRAPPHC
jgi:hypothetical protein